VPGWPCKPWSDRVGLEKAKLILQLTDQCLWATQWLHLALVVGAGFSVCNATSVVMMYVRSNLWLGLPVAVLTVGQMAAGLFASYHWRRRRKLTAHLQFLIAGVDMPGIMFTGRVRLPS
jgi:hypothetical protein